jgi:hypothetical protein
MRSILNVTPFAMSVSVTTITIESAKRLVVYKDPKDVDHRLDGMRKAGLPVRGIT